MSSYSISNQSWHSANHSPTEDTIEILVNGNKTEVENETCRLRIDDHLKIPKNKNEKPSKTIACLANLRAKCEGIKNKIHLKIPWMTVSISAVQVQIAIYFVACEVSFSKMLFSPTKINEFWRFFTYHLLHSGIVHLLLNVFLQIFIAIPLETEQNHLNVGAIYFVSILVGAAGSALLCPKYMIVGASAGVYGLLTSHLSHCILNFTELSHRIWRFAFVSSFIISDLIFDLAFNSNRNSNDIPISTVAHLSGGIAGFLWGFVVYRRLGEHRKHNYLISVSIVLLTFFLFFYLTFMKQN